MSLTDTVPESWSTFNKKSVCSPLCGLQIPKPRKQSWGGGISPMRQSCGGISEGERLTKVSLYSSQSKVSISCILHADVNPTSVQPSSMNTCSLTHTLCLTHIHTHSLSLTHTLSLYLSLSLTHQTGVKGAEVDRDRKVKSGAASWGGIGACQILYWRRPICDQNYDSEMLNPKPKRSIAAAAIYLACNLEDQKKTQTEICKVTGLTEVRTLFLFLTVNRCDGQIIASLASLAMIASLAMRRNTIHFQGLRMSHELSMPLFI